MARQRDDQQDNTSVALAKIEQITESATLQALSTRGRLERGMLLARALTELRQLVRPHVGHFIPLMNSPLGFMTDRTGRDGKEVYGVEVVTECLIEAALRGLYPIDNQFNIIAGRCYVTKNGFRHLLRNLPGFTDLRLSISVPRILNGGAVISAKASWRMNGRPDSLEADIAIRMHNGSTADQIVGKAERKALARIWAQVTGSEQSDFEEEAEVTLSPTSKTDAIARKLEERAGANGTPGITSQTSERLRAMLAEMEVSEDGLRALCESHNADPQKLTETQAREILKDLTEARDERAAIEEPAAEAS